MRFAAPPADASYRACQYTAFAPKNARFTPAFRAARAASYMPFDQYSSWPAERKPLWLARLPSFASVSTSVV